MLRSGQASRLVQVKAVSAGYPLIGRFLFSGDARIEDFRSGEVLFPKELLLALKVAPGDTVRIGEKVFRVKAEYLERPGGNFDFFELGSRLLAKVLPVQMCLLTEFFGRFHGPARRHWYLSDGGHFENTGCFELIRRRVPFIVCSDAAQDASPSRTGAPPVQGAAIAVRHYAADDSVFLGDDYLIKGVAGAIFCKLLRDYKTHGRTEFTNRELRLDPSIRLPDLADNLEARLILLSRRLAERAPHLAIEKTGRGRFRFCVRQPVELVEMAGAAR